MLFLTYRVELNMARTTKIITKLSACICNNIPGLCIETCITGFKDFPSRYNLRACRRPILLPRLQRLQYSAHSKGQLYISHTSMLFCNWPIGFDAFPTLIFVPNKPAIALAYRHNPATMTLAPAPAPAPGPVNSIPFLRQGVSKVSSYSSFGV